MESLQQLQALDFVLVVAWAILVGWGAYSGAVRQLSVLIAVVIAVVTAASLRRLGGQALAYGLGQNFLAQSEFIAFVAILCIVLLAVAITVIRAYPSTRLDRRRRLDMALGGILAAVWGIVLVLEAVLVLRYYAVIYWPGQEIVQREAAAQLERSQLVPVLQGVFAPLWNVMAPWVPATSGSPAQPSRTP